MELSSGASTWSLGSSLGGGGGESSAGPYEA